jgi:peroxiredoxin
MKKYSCLALFLGMGLLSCSPQGSNTMPSVLSPKRSETPKTGNGGYANAPARADFVDDAKSNTKVDLAALDLTFIDRNGKSVDLKNYRGKKNVVLVVTRGYVTSEGKGSFCPYCTTQTTRLIAQYDEFTKRDAEVLLVFPGPKDHVEQFVKKAERGIELEPTPFPVLLDENFAAVDKLGIRGDLAKPSTYIIDKKGQVRFAYVGTNSGDRPSVKALLQQLDQIGKS